MELAHLPGGDLVERGLADLRRGQMPVESLLVSCEKLGDTEPDSAHSRYDALVGQLTSFENALECER